MDSEEPNAAALPIDQELLSIMGGEDEIRLLDERFKHAQLHLQDLKAKGEEAFDDAKALWTKEIDILASVLDKECTDRIQEWLSNAQAIKQNREKLRNMKNLVAHLSNSMMEIPTEL